MNKTKSLAAQVIGAAAIVTLIGTSAFAESRHSDATHDHSRQRDSSRQSRDNRSNQSRTFERHDARATAPQTFERRDFRSSSPQSFRNESRSYGQSYSRGYTQYDRRVQTDNFRNRSFDRSSGFRN